MTRGNDLNTVVRLFKLHGATETARQLGLTERAVYDRIAKARKSQSITAPTKQGRDAEHPQRQKIEVTLQQLANVVVLTARQDERLNAIERRVDRLEQTPAR